MAANPTNSHHQSKGMFAKQLYYTKVIKTGYLYHCEFFKLLVNSDLHTVRTYNSFGKKLKYKKYLNAS